MLVAFDVDGVLVEVSQSYYRALPETVSYFLKSPVDSGLLLDLKIKLNLNNDWDATLAGLLFYRSGLKLDEFISQMSVGPPDFRKFYEWAKDKNITLPDYRLLVKKFEAKYRKFRARETLKISPDTLKEIKSMAKMMAVITGRTREDLAYTFRKYSLYKYFDLIITEDDLPYIERRKPSPYPLQLLIQSCGYTSPACYVGDTLTDWQMVQNFNREEEKKVLFILYRNDLNGRVKADYCVKNEKQLLEILNKISQKEKSI